MMLAILAFPHVPFAFRVVLPVLPGHDSLVTGGSLT